MFLKALDYQHAERKSGDLFCTNFEGKYAVLWLGFNMLNRPICTTLSLIGS